MTSESSGRGGDPLMLLLDALRIRGPVTRGELVEATRLSRTTVSGLLTDLRRKELLGEVQEHPGVPTGGRPATMVSLQPRAGVAVGVDVGRRHVRVVTASLGHSILGERVVRLDADGHADEVLDTAARLVDQTLAGCGSSRQDVVGVGLGVPAPLDADGRVGSLNILPGWVGRLPGPELAGRLGLPVQAENDANLGALAEALWGAGRDCSVVVHVKAATGIGAGIVLAGRLFRGSTGTAGELGHTTVTDGGDVCRCGNRGCLELLAGGPALLTQTRTLGLDVLDLTGLVAAARAGDPGVRRVLADAGDHIGLAAANLVNLLNPDVIVFGGELGGAGDLVLGPLRDRVARCAVAPAAQAAQVRPAQLGERAEALGAALLVIRELERFNPSRLLERARTSAAGART